MTERIGTALVTGATLGHRPRHRVAAIRRRRDAICVRRVWRPIMFVLRALPERVFKRLSNV